MSDLVIGDISGFKSAFDRLVAKTSGITRIVSLGDIIDRGPESKQMIEFFMNHPEHICLMGNHEHMMIKCYEEVMLGKKNPYMLLFWVYVNGGKETLESYGFTIPVLNMTRKEITNLFPEELKKLSATSDMDLIRSQFHKIPVEHINFLKTLPLFIETDTAFYSHASIKNWTDKRLFDYGAFEKDFHVLDKSCLWNRSLPDKTRKDGKLYIYGHQNTKSVLAHNNKHPVGKYIDVSETHLPVGTWSAGIDTVKAGYLTALKMSDLSLYHEDIFTS